jgi:GT2 family glycosyltransferase
LHTPDLSIVIVNYNGGHDILRCLQSLRRVAPELAMEIIVVDNGSADGSTAMMAAQHPEAHLIIAGENLGFARACNRGLSEAKGRHALLLNPDTEVRPGALRAMTQALDDHFKWGIVGARMLTESGRAYPAARRFPRPVDLFCEATKLSALFPHTRLCAHYFYGERDLDRLDDVDQVEGSALMISGRARKTVGNLDPQFFVYFEEVDWCRRVKAAGFEIHVIQAAEIVHHRATTVSKFFVQARLYNAESACRYFLKWEDQAGLRSVKRWMRAALWIREIALTIVGRAQRNDRLMLKAKAARAERRFYREFQEPAA